MDGKGSGFDDYAHKKEINEDIAANVDPSHYADYKVTPIDLVKAYNTDYVRGNAIKYIARAGKKPVGDMKLELQDLKKAEWYLKDAIKDMEEKLNVV